MFSAFVLLIFSSEVIQGGAVSLHTETTFISSLWSFGFSSVGSMTCASDRDYRKEAG